MGRPGVGRLVPGFFVVILLMGCDDPGVGTDDAASGADAGTPDAWLSDGMVDDPEGTTGSADPGPMVQSREASASVDSPSARLVSPGSTPVERN